MFIRRLMFTEDRKPTARQRSRAFSSQYRRQFFRMRRYWVNEACFSVQPLCSLCLCGKYLAQITTETQRTQRLHREDQSRYSLAQLRTTMTLGTEWLIDASGCDPAALADLDRLRAVFDRVIRDLDLHVLGEVRVASVRSSRMASVVSLYSRNRISACHTYPEFQAATFNLILLPQSCHLVLGNNAERDARRNRCERSRVRTHDSRRNPTTLAGAAK